MPELPEVETTRLSLLPGLKGRRIAGVELRRATLRIPLPELFCERVTGAVITNIRRRAKYLLFDLSDGQVMLAHLGMSGSFLLTDANHAPRKHDHVLFTLDNGMLLAFHDPRRFGLIDLLDAREEPTHKLLAHLGPEPLGTDFTPAYLAAALATRKGPIKPTLMDQQLVVGVGNIYASESLFLAGVHPMAPSYRVVSHAAKLVESIHAALNAALKSGGSSLRDFTDGTGTTGYFQHHFNTYEREGEPCVACGDTIQCITQAGRSTYFCAQCQPPIKSRAARPKKIHGEKTKK